MEAAFLQTLVTLGMLTIWVLLVVRIIRRAYGSSGNTGNSAVGSMAQQARLAKAKADAAVKAQVKAAAQQAPRAAKPMYVEAVPQMPSAEGSFTLADVMLDVQRRKSYALDTLPPPIPSLESQYGSYEGDYASQYEGGAMPIEGGYKSIALAGEAEIGSMGRHNAKETRQDEARIARAASPTKAANATKGARTQQETTDNETGRTQLLRKALRNPNGLALLQAELLRRPEY